MRFTLPDYEQWRRWFAWYPVPIDEHGQYAWLEWVERQIVQMAYGSACWYRKIDH